MVTYAMMPQSFRSLLKNVFSVFPLLFKKLWPVFLGLAVIQTGLGVIADKTPPNSISFHVVSLLISLFFLYIYIVILYQGDQLLKQQPIDLKAGLHYGLNRYFPVLGYGILLVLLYVLVGAVIGFAIGSLFYILHVPLPWLIPILSILFIFLVVLLFCAMPAIILDKVKVFSSFKMSARLVEGNWWRVFGVFFCSYLVVIIASILVILLGLAVMWPLGLLKEGSALAPMIIGHIVGFLSVFIFMPLIIGAVLVIYHDLKLRKPGVVTN